MSTFSPKFFLIDAHGFLHRNYHALPGLTTSAGLEVGALYGFVRWLLKMKREQQPAYVAVCFDSPGGCARRKTLFPAYKANRKKPDEALVNQLNLARELVRKLGFAVVAKQGVEADDLMAYLALQAAKEQIPSVLVTSDKDVYQFLSSWIHIWPSGGKDGFKGPEAAVEKFGVEVPFLPDYFSIVGDASDNVPGVKGVGPKSAVELIHQFGHLEDILRAAHNGNPDLKPTLAKKMLEHEGEALLSKQLVVLDPAFDLSFDLTDYQVNTPPKETLENLFAQYEFKNLIDLLPAQTATVTQPFQTSVSAQALLLQEALEKGVLNGKLFVHVDEEHLIVGVSPQEFAITALADLTTADLTKLKQVFQNNAVEKIGYDLKLTLRQMDLDLEGQFISCFDGRLARYLLNPSGDLSFAGACADYLSATISEEDPFLLLRAYNQFIWPLKDVLIQKLKESNQLDLLYTLEQPLMMILSSMEFAGFQVDEEWLRTFQVLLEQEIKEQQAVVNSYAGYEVNINSTKQLGTLLFEELKIPPVRKTKTGYSTDESVLEEIAQVHPIARAILEYRASNKLKTTYVDNLLLMADERHKVHSYLDQTGTVTGRLSSSSPNLQNIPVRTEKGRQLRHAFCAASGNMLVSVDYSQIDLRVLAHESNDPVLIQAFLEGGDIHTQTASQVFGVMPLLVTPQMRSSAKAINFGIIYGQGPMGLSQTLGISLREAKEYIDHYFQTYKVVRKWIDEQVVLARKNGFVKTMLGHVRYLPEFNMGVGAMTSFAQRAAINTIVQGGSADIIKKAMLDVYNAYRNTPVKLIMQVHDELILEVPQENLTQIAGHIKTLMQNAVHLRVPLLASVKTGKNWYEMEKISL